MDGWKDKECIWKQKVQGSGNQRADSRLLVQARQRWPEKYKVADLYINLVGEGYKTTLYDPLVDAEEVKKEYNIKVTNDPKVLEKEYQIVVIGTHHKVFDNIDMNKIITDKGFMCDIYGIHKPRS